MIDLTKNYNLNVSFLKGTFSSEEQIILVEADNKSTKLIFNFEEDINGKSLLLKIKHYLGQVYEYPLEVKENKAEFIFVNEILVAGNLKMSISLIGDNDEVLTVVEYLDNIEVKETLGNGEEPSEEEISTFAQAISQVNELKTSLEESKLAGDFKGDSAYEIAVKEGFKGTESEWLKTLIGATGKGLKGIYYDSSEGLLDTYIIEYTDNSTVTFTVKNGNGILNIKEISRKDNTVIYRFNFTDKSHFDYTITEGSNYDDTDIIKRLENLENNKRIVEFGVRYYYGQTSSKLERLGDSIGLIANATKDGSAVVNDFDTKPIFKDIKEVKRHKTTHKLLSIKGDADYETIDGEVMIDFPDTYWKFEEAPDKTYLDIWLCNIAKTGYFKVDKFAIGKYPLSINEEGKLQTKSGTCAEGWKGLTTWRSLVKTEYGEGACLLDWRYDVFTALYLIEFADFNSQNVLGQGISTFRYNFTADKSLLAEENTNRVVINTAGGNAFIVGQQVIIGTTDGGFQIGKYRTITAKENYSSDGITGVAITVDGEPFTTTTEVAITSCAQKTGSADEIQSSSGSMSNDGKKASSYRGVEKNSIFDWVDGRNIRNGIIYECTNPENYASDFFDVPYEALTDYTIPQETNGYIKTLGFDKNHPFCRMQKEYGGGSSTHITDYGWSNPTGQFACRVGGSANFGALAGLFCWDVSNGAGHAAWICGARVLMYQI